MSPRGSTLESAEQAQIRSAIRASQGNLTLAAKTLGIAKSTLYLKLKKYDMQDALADVRDPKLEPSSSWTARIYSVETAALNCD